MKCCTGLFQRKRCALMVQRVLAAGVLSAGVAVPAVVHAQADAGAMQIEEIMVTARKREESLQDVPVAVSALSAGDIEDLVLMDLDDIAKTTAGLVFDNEFSRTSNRPVIRGQANILGDSGVAYFIDGVYINGPIADYDLNDVQRVEVVKGPQSALYGRNTYAGAINLITKDPTDEVKSRFSAQVAGDEQYQVTASVSGPIVDGVLAGGLAFRHFERGAIFNSSFDGAPLGEQQSQSLSGSLLWTPSDRTQVRFRGYYSELDDGQPPLFRQAASANNCFQDNGSYYLGLGRYFCGELAPQQPSTDYSVQAPNAGDRVDQMNLSMKIEHDFNDRWSLTSITGYNERDAEQITEADYGPTNFDTPVFARFPLVQGAPPWPYGIITGDPIDFTFSNVNDAKDWSQELRLDFSGDRLTASFGFYYFKQEVEGRDTRQLPANVDALVAASFGRRLGEEGAICGANPLCLFPIPLLGAPDGAVAPLRNRDDSEIENRAIFGLLSYDLTDSLTLTVEARYQEEDVSQVAIGQRLGGPVTSVLNADASFDTFTPRITLDWQASEDVLLYALYSEGTKPGGFNGAAANEAGAPSFEEEDLRSFEIGAKTTLFDNQLRLNAALFHNELDGYQLTQNVQGAGEITSATVNAGDAEITGVELEMTWLPMAIEGLSVTANYAWIDSEFTEGFDQNQGVLNDVADDGLTNCSTGLEFEGADCGVGTVAFGSIAGNQIPRTSENTLFLDAEYRRPMGNGWNWFVGANYAFESSRFSQVHNLIETGDIEVINGRVGFTNGKYMINFFGKNLGGEDASPIVLRYADGGDSLRRNFVGMARRDTYFGVTASAQF